MENQILCESVHIKKNILLEYFMITEEISADYTNLKSYGIKIRKTELNEGGGNIIETKQINNVFYRKEDAEIFIDILARNSVTPISLLEVTEDYIVESLERVRDVECSMN